MRQELYRKTTEDINKINYEQNTHIAAHNKFSDFTESEINMMMGLRYRPNIQKNTPIH